ncbi:hypothetical protein CsSME_00048781 [Camellia sinensis var. sinensis]
MICRLLVWHLHIYVDDMLEKTVQFFQNRNVSIVIHNEWDFNVLCVRGANKKLIGKGKENYSGKGIKNTQVFVKMSTVLLILNITNFQ